MESNVQQTALGQNEVSKCTQEISLKFCNLSYISQTSDNTGNLKTILKNINGQFQSGNLTAILGPSGAGKSTLLNVLSGFRTNGATGSVMINGKQRNLSAFKKLSCYIPQHVVLLQHLTTQETMWFAADLKLGTNMETTSKHDMVDNILELLGLIKSKNTYVNKLSGGEKKRLSIAVELLTNPPIMFFDEPTSGIDSSSSLQVMSHLKSLAEGGRIVVCSIHQPGSKILELFDDILVLAEGQCLYNGPLQRMVCVFQEEGFSCPDHYNRADFVIQVARKKFGDGFDKLVLRAQKDHAKSSAGSSLSIQELEQAVDGPGSSINAERESNRELSSEMDSRGLQENLFSTRSELAILIKRSMFCTYRNMNICALQTFTHIFMGLLCGVICYDVGNDASKAMISATIIFSFTLCIFSLSPLVTVFTFPVESEAVKHELQNNWYSVWTYVVSKLITDIPMQILCPFGFLLVSYFMTNQPTDSMRFERVLGISILMAFCGQSTGFVMGSAFNAKIGLFCLLCFNITLLLLSGFIIRIRDMPSCVQWLADTNYFHLCYESTMIIIYGNNRTNLRCSKVYCMFKKPLNILEEFDIPESDLKTDILGLISWVIFLQALFYFVLKFKINRL